MNDKISVIMACYNCEKTVSKAIDSILAQTYENWKLICCDDGSTDGTLEILLQYEKKYPDKFLIIRNSENKMLPYSLNRCLECADTNFIARMDADDWSHPERFEKQVSYLKEHPDVDLLGTGVTVSDGNKKIASIIKPEYPVPEDMLKQNCFSHATIMTYKRVYDDLGGYSLDPTVIRVEDVDLWCRFFAAGFKGVNLQEELYSILENADAVKRRTFKGRLNSARTRRKGYRLMGFKGIVCYKPYLLVLIALLPRGIYKRIHMCRLKKQRG